MRKQSHSNVFGQIEYLDRRKMLRSETRTILHTDQIQILVKYPHQRCCVLHNRPFCVVYFITHNTFGVVWALPTLLNTPLYKKKTRTIPPLLLCSWQHCLHGFNRRARNIQNARVRMWGLGYLAGTALRFKPLRLYRGENLKTHARVRAGAAHSWDARWPPWPVKG